MRDTIHTRAVAVKPNSFDQSTRSFTAAVLATSRPIRVRGGIDEVLDLTGARLPESLPLLLDHRSDVRSTVGRVTNLRIQGDELVADGRITADPSLDWLCARMADGTVGSLSVGYTPEAVRNGAGRSRTVVPRFIHASLVSEPADDRAGIRSVDQPDGIDEQPDPATRNGRIRSLCRALDLPQSIVDRAIDEIWSDAEINDAFVERRGGRDIRVTSRAVGLDEPSVYRAAMVEGLVARMTGVDSQGPARELAALSWADLHRRHLRQTGCSVAGLSDAEVIVRALSTSDMPIIAGSAVNVALRRTFEAAASPIAAVFGTRELPDFRPQIEALVDWSTLKIDRVNELGEYKSSYITESGETITLYTVGGITSVSRPLYINGAGALRNLSEAHGRRLAADVNDRMVAFVTQANGAGPTMSDNGAVFSGGTDGRGNVLTLDTTDTDTIIDGVLDARASAARRMGAGNVMVGVTPSVWVVAPEFEGEAMRALATVAAAEAGNANPLAGRLQLITEPRLIDPDVSYLVAPPATMDGAVRVSLAGQPGPYTESRWGFEIDAVQFKIRLDFGLGWLEWRSWTRLDHAGA